MKSLFYSWLVFQILIGIWMFISPFVFGFGETDFGVNNMILGGVMVILGVRFIFYEVNRVRRETTAPMEHEKERVRSPSLKP